jgi:hypothetical protein
VQNSGKATLAVISTTGKFVLTSGNAELVSASLLKTEKSQRFRMAVPSE